MKAITLCLLLATFLLAGCKEETARSVEFYTDNHEARKATLEQCEEEGAKTQDCENAFAAIWRASSESDSMPGID